jgi:hypothetical protein
MGARAQVRAFLLRISQFPLGHLRYAMIHKITIVPIIGTNESSDNHGDRPVRRKIRHDGTIVTVISTTQKSTEITSNTLATLSSASPNGQQPKFTAR